MASAIFPTATSNMAEILVAPPEEPISLHGHLLGAVQAAIIATDLQGQIIYWNGYAEELYGWAAAEVLGRNIIEITVAAEAEKEAAEIMLLLQAGKSWKGEFRVLRKDGTQFTASVTDSPIFDENGVLIGIVGVSQDLSSHKEIEETYRKAQEELELRVEQRTQELNAANESLRKLSARLLQMQDEGAPAHCP